MKILFVQKMNGISGSELYLMQIMPELQKRGYQIEMLIVYPITTNNNDRFIKHLEQAGIKTHEIYGHNDISLILIRKINKLLKAEQYDLVQTNLIHADFWLAVIKLFFNKRIRIISVHHGYDPNYQAKYGYDLKYLKYGAFYWIQRFSCAIIDFNVTISRGLYNLFIEGGISGKNKLKTIYYGLTLKALNDDEDIALTDSPYLLIIGRLISVKGHVYLINAWKEVAEAYPLLKLRIVGDGELRKELETMVFRENLQEHISFVGHVPNPHPLIKRSVFTIVTSSWEGFGLILLESWLHKKPIVSFDGPAMNEIIDDNENGLLAKVNDSRDLAAKIIYLLNNEPLIAQLGENGYNKLTNYYTLKRMTDEMEEIYQRDFSNL